ncbi:MAG: hypothetical protein AAFZ89_16715 [Bacteroidota bacterium]
MWIGKAMTMVLSTKKVVTANKIRPVAMSEALVKKSMEIVKSPYPIILV